MHLPGSIIDNQYQIIQQLGQSETEKTYLAKNLQAPVEAKCIIEHLDFGSEHQTNWQIIQQYLLQEVTIVQRLGDHPQIPQIQHYFIRGQQFYLVREYIDGDNLGQEVAYKKFDEAETVGLLQDGLRILDFIHKTNVIHRDVQPTHLVRRKEDNAYVLINFGALRKIKADEINLQGRIVLTKDLGNSDYSAPEQKTGEFFSSSDIYALGGSAIYALTGKSPLELEQEDLDWRSQCQISQTLEDILLKMMSPIVEQRYHSALEVLQDLRPLLNIKQLVGGRYSITSYLGGNEGVDTYLANNLRRPYQSPCLIKQIELPHNDEEGGMQLARSFVEELSVIERLGYHEQIPQLRDHFEENDQFYLVQEYIQGNSLAQMIAQQTLSVAEIIQILESTLSGLQFIHQNRLIHRNIKPTNLILRELDQQVIITDFGLLHDIKIRSHQSRDSRSTRSSERQNYWPPEQAAGRPTISSDLYAVGMSIIEALTRSRPATFPREQTGKLMWDKNLSLDRRLIKIIDKLIELDLGQRYQSAEQVLSELAKISNYSSNSHRQQAKITRYPDSKTMSLSRNDKSSRSRRNREKSGFPWLIGILGVACLLGSIEFAFPTIRPFYYWHQGEKLLANQPQAALDIYTKAIDLKPKSWRAWSGRGDALMAQQRYPQALEAYIEATELNPKISGSWQKRGNALFYLDNFTGAITAYNQALELAPEDVEIFNHKGRALFQLQQYEAALVMQDAALERDPRNPQFLSDRAQVLFKLGKYTEALDLFNQVQTFKPNSLQLWQGKFFALQALNRPQEAEQIRREVNNNYIKILQQQPQSLSTWIDQGDFLAATQMYNKAVIAYDQAIKLMPDNYRARLGKGKALAQQGKGTQALAALDRTLQIRPQSDQAWQATGMVFQQQNNLTRALSSYDQAISLNANNPSLWRDRAIVLNQQGKYSQAIESLTKAREINAYDLKIWQELAIAWSALGDDNEAIFALNRGLKIYPQSSDLWSWQGLIQTRNGQYNKACQTYRDARATGGGSKIIADSMIQLGCRMN